MWLMMTVSTLSGSMPMASSPSRTGLTVCAAAPCADGFVETGVDDDGAAVADDRPDEIVERHVDVMRVAAEEIVAGRPRMMAVFDGKDVVEIGHCFLPIGFVP